LIFRGLTWLQITDASGEGISSADFDVCWLRFPLSRVLLSIADNILIFDFLAFFRCQRWLLLITGWYADSVAVIFADAMPPSLSITPDISLITIFGCREGPPFLDAFLCSLHFLLSIISFSYADDDADFDAAICRLDFSFSCLIISLSGLMSFDLGRWFRLLFRCRLFRCQLSHFSLLREGMLFWCKDVISISILIADVSSLISADAGCAEDAVVSIRWWFFIFSRFFIFFAFLRFCHGGASFITLRRHWYADYCKPGLIFFSADWFRFAFSFLMLRRLPFFVDVDAVVRLSCRGCRFFAWTFLIIGSLRLIFSSCSRWCAMPISGQCFFDSRKDASLDAFFDYFSLKYFSMPIFIFADYYWCLLFIFLWLMPHFFADDYFFADAFISFAFFFHFFDFDTLSWMALSTFRWCRHVGRCLFRLMPFLLMPPFSGCLIFHW